MLLSWEKGEKYYKLRVEKNIFGSLDVICYWGRFNTKLGGYKIVSCNSYSQVKQVICFIKRKRRSRGYIFLS